MQRLAKKTARRERGVTALMDACLRLKKVVPNWASADEVAITTGLYQLLVAELTRYYDDQGVVHSEPRARRAIIWERDPRVTVNMIQFLGTQHRPDFVVELEPGTRVAVEIKRGETGQAIREGLGQALVYGRAFQFVAYLFVDTSKAGRIAAAARQPEEADFIKGLWSQHNVRFAVI